MCPRRFPPATSVARKHIITSVVGTELRAYEFQKKWPQKHVSYAHVLLLLLYCVWCEYTNNNNYTRRCEVYTYIYTWYDVFRTQIPAYLLFCRSVNLCVKFLVHNVYILREYEKYVLGAYIIMCAQTLYYMLKVLVSCFLLCENRKTEKEKFEWRLCGVVKYMSLHWFCVLELFVPTDSFICVLTYVYV